MFWSIAWSTSYLLQMYDLRWRGKLVDTTDERLLINSILTNRS